MNKHSGPFPSRMTTLELTPGAGAGPAQPASTLRACVTLPTVFPLRRASPRKPLSAWSVPDKHRLFGFEKIPHSFAVSICWWVSRSVGECRESECWAAARDQSSIPSVPRSPRRRDPATERPCIRQSRSGSTAAPARQSASTRSTYDKIGLALTPNTSSSLCTAPVYTSSDL